MGGGGRGAYLKNRDQIINVCIYAMKFPKTHGAECPTYGLLAKIGRLVMVRKTFVSASRGV